MSLSLVLPCSDDQEAKIKIIKLDEPVTTIVRVREEVCPGADFLIHCKDQFDIAGSKAYIISSANVLRKKCEDGAGNEIVMDYESKTVRYVMKYIHIPSYARDKYEDLPFVITRENSGERDTYNCFRQVLKLAHEFEIGSILAYYDRKISQSLRHGNSISSELVDEILGVFLLPNTLAVIDECPFVLTELDRNLKPYVKAKQFNRPAMLAALDAKIANNIGRKLGRTWLRQVCETPEDFPQALPALTKWISLNQTNLGIWISIMLLDNPNELVLSMTREASEKLLTFT